MNEVLRPSRGGCLRPFGCGWFIREYLTGSGPESSSKINPSRGATQAEISYEYKEALARATAREHAERSISDMVMKGKDVTEKRAEIIYEVELKKVSRKFSHMRYHSFLMYFAVLKRLGWVEPTGEVEQSAIQENFTEASQRIYYRLTNKGSGASDSLWSNPFYTLYPQHGPSHGKAYQSDYSQFASK